MIYEALDRREKCLCVFMDLWKAFDLVNNEISLSKLHSNGIRGIANEWFRSYLLDRKQIVSVNTSNGPGISMPLKVNLGVPHGPILGPDLYIIYGNGFPINFEECKVVGYADDPGMLLRSMLLGDLCMLAKNVITKCMEWFSQQIFSNES
jgi:hypothetical protein